MKSALFSIFSISCLGNFVCLIPLMFSWALPSVPLGDSEITVVQALKSTEFIYTVVFGIAISFPVVFDFIGHSILCPEDFFSYRDSISNLILLIAFLVPDLILLFYVIPEVNLVLLYILEIQRIINSACATFAYLNYFGGGIFENKSMIILSIMIVAGATLRLYSFFYLDITQIIFEAISLTLTGLGSLLFSFYLMLFTKHLWSVYFTGRLSSDQFCCIVYIISSATAFSAVWGLVIMYHYPRWYQYNKTMLVVQNVLYSWFYLVITVFQGRSAIREASIAKQSLEIKRMFVRYISHEIRTPLNTVKMGLQVLHQELQDSRLNEDKICIVDDCQLACGNAVNILNDLLMFDKLEAGILKLELETFPVWDFLELTLRPFRLQALQKKVDLIIKAPLFTSNRENSILQIGYNNNNKSKSHSIPPLSPPICLTADRYKFSQVISNIVSNAIKFTKEDGQVVVGVYLLTEDYKKIEEKEVGERRVIDIATYLRIEVIDTGAGLSEENQKQLFHEIIQFNPGVLQNGGGSGLGLYISKGIMDAHGGKISVHSAGEGCGCTFTIDIKLNQYRGGISGGGGGGGGVVREPGILPPANGNAALPVSSLLPQSQTTPAEDTASRKKISFTKLPILKARNVSTMAHWSSSSLIVPTVATDIITPPMSSDMLNGNLLMFDDTQSLTKAAFNRRGQNSMLSISPLQSYRQVPPSDSSSPISTLTTTTREGKEKKIRSLPKVLVVDDSKLNRDMMRRLLKNRCEDIVEAADGQEALNIVQQAMASEMTYDVILVDYMMPVMNGPTAVKHMREVGYLGLIIGLTGNALPEDLAYFKSHGADEVLVKPLDISEYDTIIAKRILMDSYSYFI